MKPGFYLSPDGKHVVELVSDGIFRFNVYGFIGGFNDWLECFELSELEVLFSSWEFLNE